MQRAFLLAVLLSTICAPSLAANLTVAVAANLQYAFSDLKEAYAKESGDEITPVYNSSGKFAAQILNGAPFDVFLSADMEYPEKLHQEGFAVEPPKAYAYGALVLWTMKDLDLAGWQSLLAASSVSKIAIPNPKTAPYGREVIKALRHFGLDEALKPKLVFGESIAQTNQYIYSGTADAGFTAKAVVLAPEMRGQGKWIELPSDAYQPIAQGAVILKHGQQTRPDAARRFYEFIYSAKARAIFGRYGYSLP